MCVLELRESTKSNTWKCVRERVKRINNYARVRPRSFLTRHAPLNIEGRQMFRWTGMFRAVEIICLIAGLTSFSWTGMHRFLASTYNTYVCSAERRQRQHSSVWGEGVGIHTKNVYEWGGRQEREKERERQIKGNKVKQKYKKNRK